VPVRTLRIARLSFMNWLNDFGLVGLFDLLDMRVWWWPNDLIAEFGLMSCEVSWWDGQGNSDGGACIVVVKMKVTRLRYVVGRRQNSTRTMGSIPKRIERSRRRFARSNAQPTPNRQIRQN
jgi:hypothetical protein